jgi:GSH-dependent disulfide-bond oxidoreductase
MIHLYTAGTGNGRRASIVLEECGLPYTYDKIEFDKPKPEAFLTLNPLGAIPAIIDPDGPGGKSVPLTQSGAIAIYCAEKAGKFLPTDALKRATVFQWFMHVMSDQAPVRGAMFQLNGLPDKPASAIAHFEKRMTNFLKYANDRLGKAEYLAGEISIADFALYPVAAGSKDLIEKIGGLDNLKKWVAKVGARPGVTKGMAVPA